MAAFYALRVLLLSLCLQEVASITCKTTSNQCTNWGACVFVGTLPTCSNNRCAKVYTFDPTLDSGFNYQRSTGCSAGTGTATDCEFTSSFDATCTEYCNTANCNEGLYAVTTAPAVRTTGTQCVQCTSQDPNSDCFKGTVSKTQCNGGGTEWYCSTLHAVSLNQKGEIGNQVVFRGCASQDLTDGCSVGPLTLGSASYAQAVTCSKTCAGTTANGGDGCNNEAVPLGLTKGSGLSCNYCNNPKGACTSTTSMSCSASQSYCYTKMVYTEGNGFYSDEVTIVSEERGCGTEELTSQCSTVTSDIINSNIATKSCQESCTTDGCNSEYPNRPRCSQCEGSYYDGSGNLISETDPSHFKWCKENPPMPKSCPDISYTHCYAYQKYIPDGDNEVKWGYSKEFKRGCLKESSWSKCKKRDWQDGRKADHCQFVCNEDDCNLGSGSSEATLATVTILAAVAIRKLFC